MIERLQQVSEEHRYPKEFNLKIAREMMLSKWTNHIIITEFNLNIITV